MSAQIAADTAFIFRLSAIHFSPDAEVYASLLRSTVTRYIALLTQYLANPQPLDQSDVPHLDDVRVQASSHLRATLGLQQSSCVVLRP